MAVMTTDKFTTTHKLISCYVQ